MTTVAHHRCELPIRLTPTGSLTRLNDDVLLYLFRMLTKKHLLDLLSTCRSLFRSGLPELLGRPYKLCDKDIPSFYDFLLAFAPASFSLLRTFEFLPLYSTVHWEIVAKLLQHATGLQSLRLNVEYISTAQQDFLRQTMPSLSKLRGLHLERGNQSLTLSILTRMRAPLVFIHLTLDDGLDYGCAIPLLENFCDTLQCVALSSLTLSEVAFHCPKVTSLFLEFCDDVTLPTLVTVFPNLELLSIRTNRIYVATPDRDTEYNKMRQDNVAFQKCRRWKSLVSLTADLMALYTMGLQEEIASLAIPVSVDFGRGDFVWLQETFKLLRPEHLELGVTDADAASTADNLHDLLKAGMDRLLRLDLDIGLMEDNPVRLLVSLIVFLEML